MKYVILLIYSLLITISSQAQTFEINWDSTINFDGQFSYLNIDTSVNNIWQIGKPNKVYFDLASATNNAIVTDTINYYPKSNFSYFDIDVASFFEAENKYLSSVFLEIHHKYDTDTLTDGGYITVSYDNGSSWVNIIKDEFDKWEATPKNDFHSRSNLYGPSDKLLNDNVGFSGRSKGWQTTWFGWFLLPVSPNPKILSGRKTKTNMIIRFNFLSDSLDHIKEGWLIDRIKIYTIDIGSKINALYKDKLKIYPNPIQSTAIIKFKKNYDQLELLFYNNNGQLISNKNCVDCSSFEFNKNNLDAGIYTLIAKSRNKIIGIKKISIN